MYCNYITLTRHCSIDLQDRPWTDVCVGGENEDIQYRNTVWDMFQGEIKYLTNLLQPLELVSMLFVDSVRI